MRKVIKIFLSVFSWLLLVAIFVPLAAALMLHLPSVQTYAVKQVAGVISRRIGAEVSVERVQVKLINRVALDGVYIEDLNRDTLLYVKQLSVGLTAAGVLRGDLSLGKVRLAEPRFYLHQQPDTMSNLRHLLLSLRGDKPRERSAGEFRLSATGVEIEDMSFVHTKLEGNRKDYGVDFTNLDVHLKRLDVSDLEVWGDSISMRIDDIALREKSGFSVERLESRSFSISGSGLRFEGLEFDASGSHIEMDSLNLLYRSWQMADFLNDVRFEASMENTRVDFGTIAFFAQGLRDWNLVVADLDATVEGPVADMKGRFARSQVYDARLIMDFAMKGLPEVNDTRFDLKIDTLTARAADIRAIMDNVSEKSVFSEDIYAKLEQLDDIAVRGNFSGRLTHFVAGADIKTGMGEAAFDMAISPERDRVAAFSGNLRLDNVNLGGLVGAKGLGNVTLAAALRGKTGSDSLTFDTDAEISHIAFNGYNYRNMAIEGSVRNRLFTGVITSSDPNIDFDFSGMLDFNDSVPRYDFAMELRRADLYRLNVNPRDTLSILSCRLNASASGASLDELNGEIEIGGVTYISNIDTLHTERIVVSGRNSAVSKNIDVRSDFADAQFRSRTSYAELFPHMERMLQVYMPTLSPRQRDEADLGELPVTADASNYSLVKLNVKETDNLAGVILPGLIIAKGTQMSLLFNPYIGKFSFTATSEYIEYNNNFASDIEVTSRDEGDSLALYVRADDLYLAGLYMPQFSVNAGARDNKINAATRFSNPRNGMSALVGVTATMGRDSTDNKARALVRFTPSTFTADGKTWSLGARGITLGGGKVLVDNFAVLGGGEMLWVDGVVSENRADTLKIRLSNFDITPISQMTSTIGYDLRGKMSGEADMSAAKRNGMIHASIEFDSMRINTTPVPSSVFTSVWDFENERARFAVTERGKQDTLIRGYYRPAEKSYLAYLDLEGVDLKLLDPFLVDVVSDIEGVANANLRFSGVGRELKTNGKITVPQLTARIDYLNVPYTLRGGELEFKDNRLKLKRTRLYDGEGNSGAFDLWVDLNNLKNVSYGLSVRPENLLVMNTSELENDMFYGKVYASGTARIDGDKRATNIDVNATTAGSSEFHLPLSGKSDVVRSDLVVFKQPDRPYVDSSDYLVRKRMIIDRQRRVQRDADEANLNIDMVLNVRPNALVEIVIDPKTGGVLRGRGEGSLTLNINPAANAFTMYGDYQISDGVYVMTLQNINLGNFAIEEGSNMQWTGDPVDAALDISAVYKLKTSLAPLLQDVSTDDYKGTVPVECRIIMSDRLSDPEMTFNISVPGVDPKTQSLVSGALNTQEMMATQFFWLLATRNFYRETGQGMNIGSTSGGTDQLVNILSSQLSNWLSNDRFNIGMSYRAQSEYNSDEFNVDFSTYLAGDRLLLEVEGNYDANNTPTLGERNASNLTGDFALTWLIDRGGNLRLKGFTRTVDRFDENQGLQESGLGIYYREDFDTFGDIVRNFRQRFPIFGRKKRAEREAARKEEAEKEGLATDGDESGAGNPEGDNLKTGGGPDGSGPAQRGE